MRAVARARVRGVVLGGTAGSAVAVAADFVMLLEESFSVLTAGLSFVAINASCHSEVCK